MNHMQLNRYRLKRNWMSNVSNNCQMLCYWPANQFNIPLQNHFPWKMQYWNCILLSYLVWQINQNAQNISCRFRRCYPCIFKCIWNGTMVVIQLSLHVTHFLGFCFISIRLKFSLSSLVPTDPPVVRLLGAPQIDLEEGKDSLVLRCEADANPPANIVWKKFGRTEIASLQVSTMFKMRFFSCTYPPLAQY